MCHIIYAEVLVNQDIAQSSKTLPIHLGISRSKVVGNMFYGFAISDYRVSGFSVGKKIFKRHAVNEIGDKRMAITTWPMKADISWPLISAQPHS